MGSFGRSRPTSSTGGSDLRPSIYLDNGATTAIDPRVLSAMLPYFTETYGNPSSLHAYGEDAREAVESARERVAATLRVRADEVVFTSGGTESNNLAVKGVAFGIARGRQLVTSAVEHTSVLAACRWLGARGWDITQVGVDSEGFVDLEAFRRALTPTTALVSVMHSNSEVGTLEPVAEISELCRERGIPFHTDASQSYGKVRVRAELFDLITLSGHKIYGPKGVAALVVRNALRNGPRTVLDPLLHGGGQEQALRSGTENVPGIVGFARAAEICQEEMETESARVSRLRDRVIQNLSSYRDAYLNGPKDGTRRLPGNVNVAFNGLEGQATALLLQLSEHGVSVSTGSACSSHEGDAPSHVLTAMGRNAVEAKGALRITIGRFNTQEEIDYFLDQAFPESFRTLPSIFTGG